VVLALLILFFISWDMWAVLQDNRVGECDTTLEDAFRLRSQFLQGKPPGDILHHFVYKTRKSPLTSLLVAGLFELVNDPLLGARVLSIACHLLLFLMVYWMALKLTRSRLTGLFAVVLVGTFPAIYGWFRMEYHEPMLAVVLLWLLQIMMGGLRQRSTAIFLGLAMGLGALFKAGFFVYAFFPCICLFLIQRKELTVLKNYAIAVAVFGAVAGWWYLANLGKFSSYVQLSSSALSAAEAPPLLREIQLKCFDYMLHLPYLAPFILTALAGAVYAWRWGYLDTRALTLLLSTILGTIFLLVTVFDFWSRYMVPILPVAGLLIAVGGAGLSQRFSQPLWRNAMRVLGAGLSLLLLTWFCYDNLHGYHIRNIVREHTVGLVSPDRRAYNSMERIEAFLRKRKLKVVSDHYGWFRCRLPGPVVDIRAFYGRSLPRIPQSEVLPNLHGGQTVHLLVCHNHEDILAKINRAETIDHHSRPLFQALSAHPKEIVRTFVGHDEVFFSLIKVSPQPKQTFTSPHYPITMDLYRIH